MAPIDWLSIRASLLSLICPAAPAVAQAPPPFDGAQGPEQGRRAQGPQVVSPEVTGDRRVVLHVFAPQAQAVRLNASDIPGVPFGPGATMTNAQNGVWEITVGPVPAGGYRYSFMINGVATIDPHNPSISESNTNSWNLVYVSGSETFDTRNVPHGSPGDPFVNDFVTDVMPYVAKHYRVFTDRPNTAIAGLSMRSGTRVDGAGGVGDAERGDVEFGQREEGTDATAELFKKHGFTPVYKGFTPVYKESPGGHTWLNWRDYLSTFAPQLFQ